MCKHSQHGPLLTGVGAHSRFPDSAVTLGSTGQPIPTVAVGSPDSIPVADDRVR